MEENKKTSFMDLVSDVYQIDSSLYNNYDVKRGLRNLDGSGVLAGLTKICQVHGYILCEGEKVAAQGKLSYRGYDIDELAKSCGVNGLYKFEEVCYLLLFGHLPTKDELEDFIDFLADNSELPTAFIEDVILKTPSKDIMNKLSRSILTLYSYDEKADDTDLNNVLRQSLELIAKMPNLAAYIYKAKAHYFDKKSLVLHKPKKEYSFAENILHMIRDDSSFTKEEAEILDLALLLHAEHGGGNNSAFTCRVLTSSGTDTYSAISGALNALKGPKHGGANLKVCAMMEDIKEHVSNWNDQNEVFEYLKKIIEKKAGDKSGLIYGMGHAVYTLSDPRTILLKEQARRLSEELGFLDEFKLYELIEELSPKVFEKVKGDNKVISANVDFYSGFVYKMLNIPKELYTPLFAIARIAGWAAHRMEELVSGGRILRPAYKSVCKNDKKFEAISDR